MESRLAATARVIFGVFSRHQSPPQGLATAFIPTRRIAGPVIHSQISQSKENEAFVAPNPPYPPSPKLQSTGVNQHLDPITQQKRRQTTSGTDRASPLEGVSCAGLDDGTPWPDEREDSKRRQEEDNKEYYSHHKASPLSEIEVADTRKPITRATDGTAGGGGEVVLWREEQLDTVEDSLRRAMEMWKQSAMRGDPDSPHGRVLRALRGENW